MLFYAFFKLHADYFLVSILRIHTDQLKGELEKF
jgi:hypothetical protein